MTKCSLSLDYFWEINGRERIRKIKSEEQLYIQLLAFFFFLKSKFKKLKKQMKGLKAQTGKVKDKEFYPQQVFWY